MCSYTMTMVRFYCVLLLSAVIADAFIFGYIHNRIYRNIKEFKTMRVYATNAAESSPSSIVTDSVTLSLGQSFTVPEFKDTFGMTDSVMQGVYALEDQNGTVQIVESSLDIYSDVLFHSNSSQLGDKAYSVRVQSFRIPNKDAMYAYRDELIRQTNPAIPPRSGAQISKGSGATVNDDDDDDDDNDKNKARSMRESLRDVSAHSDAYIDREIVHKYQTDNNNESEQDNESVQQQSKQQPDQQPHSQRQNSISSGDTIISPFADGGSASSDQSSTTDTATISTTQPTDNADAKVKLEFTLENVDLVLNEIRPYLIADGGNVTVVSVSATERSVQLVLQGACGSCPSSTTTMKLGVERILKENFANLGAITAVDPLITESPTLGLLKEVSQSLEKIQPAIRAMGGEVTITDVSVETSTVYVQFEGPIKLKKGIEMVLLDSPLVQHVEFPVGSE